MTADRAVIEDALCDYLGDVGRGVEAALAVRDALVDAGYQLVERAELEELRRDSALIRASETRHIIEFGAWGWTLQHPLDCHDDLLSCAWNQIARDEGMGTPAWGEGRYVMTGEPGRGRFVKLPDPS